MAVRKLAVGDIVHFEIDGKVMSDVLTVLKIENDYITFDKLNKSVPIASKKYLVREEVKKEKRSLLSYIIEVLEKENRPMSVMEISQKVIEYGYVCPRNKTQEKTTFNTTVSSRITAYCKKGNNEIVCTERGVYKHKKCQAVYLKQIEKLKAIMKKYNITEEDLKEELKRRSTKTSQK